MLVTFEVWIDRQNAWENISYLFVIPKLLSDCHM